MPDAGDQDDAPPVGILNRREEELDGALDELVSASILYPFEYVDRGYYDFRVLSAISELAPDDGAFGITLTIDEGDKYNFGTVEVVTENDRLNPDFLKMLLPIRTGDEAR